MTALCSGKICTIFPEKGALNFWKACTIALEYSGIPRMINRVCEKALMYAFQNQKRLIDDYMIKFVVEHEMLGMVTS